MRPRRPQGIEQGHVASRATQRALAPAHVSRPRPPTWIQGQARQRTPPTSARRAVSVMHCPIQRSRRAIAMTSVCSKHGSGTTPLRSGSCLPWLQLGGVLSAANSEHERTGSNPPCPYDQHEPRDGCRAPGMPMPRVRLGLASPPDGTWRKPVRQPDRFRPSASGGSPAPALLRMKSRPRHPQECGRRCSRKRDP
jgi:hypothetical protein